MTRYQGEEIPSLGRIALICNDAIGNYAIASVVGQSLKARIPEGHLHLFTGSRVAEFMDSSTWCDEWTDIFQTDLAKVLRYCTELERFELVVNIELSTWAKTIAGVLAADSYVCGPCVAPDGRGDLPFEENWRGELWKDKEWIAEDVLQRYPELDSRFIAHLFAELTYHQGELPLYSIPQKVPKRDIPDVLIATAASLPEKLWPTEKWIELIKQLKKEGKSVGLLGAKPSDQAKFWKGANEEEKLVAPGLAEDLRGELSLPEVVGALDACSLVITLDNGILHLASSTSTPTVGLFRHGIHRLWAPPVENLIVIEPGPHRMVRDIELDDIFKKLNNFQLNFMNF